MFENYGCFICFDFEDMDGTLHRYLRNAICSNARVSDCRQALSLAIALGRR